MQSSTFRVNLFIYRFKLDFESQIILSVVSDFYTPLCVCVYRFCTRVWETNLSQWTLTPIQMDAGAFVKSS